jgi:DNA-binding MarR family transcriptional regulator
VRNQQPLRYAEFVPVTQWLDEIEMHAWRSLLRAHSRLLARLDADLQCTQGISANDYAVLVELSEEGGQMRMSELAERLLLSPSGLTRRLDGLVSTGLVERRRCGTDRRGAFAVLTESGRSRLEAAAPDHVAQVRRHFVDRLSRKELELLAHSLDKVTPECPGD